MNDDTVARLNDLSPQERALVLEALQKSALETRQSGIARRTSENGPIPLSHAQQTLWLTDQLYPNSQTYTEFSAMRLLGGLDVSVLERSLCEIVRRHEVLRTTFALVDGSPAQLIGRPAESMKLPFVDLSALPRDQRDAEVQRLAGEDSSHFFNLARGPLLRLRLVKLSEEEHLLLMAAHHIVLDGWSVGIFGNELGELYSAFSRGKPSPLKELSIQYADFATWQHENKSKEDLESQLGYWTQQLNDLPPLLQLAHHRPKVETFAGARQHFKLPETLTASLNGLSRRENVTLFMTLLSGFMIMLSRYSNQSLVPVGTPVANRNQTEIEGLIGFFVNTLVLRGDLSGNPTVRELLQRVRQVAIAAYEHSDVPFGSVVEALKPERSGNYNPLFQVVFNLQNTPKRSLELSGLSLSTVEIGSVTAKFDLMLSIEETSDGLNGNWEYNTDLFDSPTITRMTGHLQTLLESFVADPEQCLDDLPLLTEIEKRQVLRDWNDTAKVYPQAVPLHQLFEEQAERTPDRIALIFESEELSYGELNRRANQLAHYLRRLGVDAEQVVGVMMERSIDLVVSLLGILKAGGAFVPLDPSYPEQRLSFMVADAQINVVLTIKDLDSKAVTQSAEVICLDTDQEKIKKEAEHNPRAHVSGQNLVYVIYTSGSTGQPKGAMNTHAGICNRLLWMQSAYPLTEGDCVIQKTPISFDVSVWEFFWPLIMGARLLVARPEGHKDCEYLVDLIKKQKVTTVHFVPSMLQAFVEAKGLEDCTTVRRVICSGEALPFELQERFFTRMSAELFNLYGPTEAAVEVTYWKCERESSQTIVPMGKPIANTEMYVLDPQQHAVPVGVNGDLYIGGDGLARGYVGRPDLTAEKFMPHPFSKSGGQRLYRTGDVGRWLSDGNIEFIGRADAQVKVRGYRVELGEVEAFLGQHPAVREAAVVVREDVDGSRRLASYISIKTGSTFSKQALVTFLADKLPAYALPSEFVVLDSLPRLPSGKFDRVKLLSLSTSESQVDVTPQTDWTELERSIGDIWKNILKISTVERDDNFFWIGGDSMSAIRVHNRLGNIIHKRLAITDLFKHPTISSLAQFISADIVIGEI